MTLWKCFQANWLLPLLALAILGLAQMFMPGGMWRYIENDVKITVEQTLRSHGMGWAKVDTHNRGRDVLLSGSAPSEQEKAKAIQLASEHAVYPGGYDVARKVDWDGDIMVPLVEGNLYVAAVDGKVTIAGVVANAEERQVLLDTAVRRYGLDNVTDQLTVAENIKPLANLDQLIDGFDLDNGVLKLKSGQATISGEVIGEERKNSIAENMAALLGDAYELSNRIKAVQPPENIICQAQLVETMSASKIYFELGKAAIKPESDALLMAVTDILLECPKANIEVAGHTDSAGSDSVNVPLSQARAQSVVDYLLEKGIAADRLSSVGYGSAKPIDSNDTQEGRAANRRIEFTVK